MSTRAPLHVTDDGEVPFRRPVAGVDPVGDADFVTKAWAEANLGGGGGGGGGVGGGGLLWAGPWESVPPAGVSVSSYAGGWS